MNPKIFLTDLDGTLICSDGSIQERTKSILKNCQKRGIYVVIATARYWIGAERYIEEITHYNGIIIFQEVHYENKSVFN